MLDFLQAKKIMGADSSSLLPRLLSLFLGSCIGISLYKLIKLHFPPPPFWIDIAAVGVLSLLGSVVIYLFRSILLPGEWKILSWYQKTGGAAACLLLSYFILMLGYIPYDDPLEVTLEIYATEQDDPTVFYCKGLYSRFKKRIVLPDTIASDSILFKGVVSANRGDGLWTRMPSMSSSVQIVWKGKIQKRLFPISIGFGTSKAAGKVTLILNGEKRSVDLGDGKGAESYIQFSGKKLWLPSLHFIYLMISLAVILYRPFISLFIDVKNILSDSYKYLSVSNSQLLIFIFIFIPVVTSNLENVFGPSFLLHDDPSFYRHGINNMVYWPFWNKYFSLNAFTEGFSWWIMANYSPYIVRFLYLLIYMTGISLCVYWIARRIFNLCPVCSYAGAVLPAIYPMQYQIVAGINLSYTLISTFVVLLSLIIGFRYLTRGAHSWLLVILSGTLFAVSASLSEHPVFLSAALGFIYLLSSSRWKRKILLLAPVVLTTCAVLYRMMVVPRAAAVPYDLPWDVILSRIKTFFVLISPFSEGFKVAFLFDVILIFFGILSLFIYSPLRNRIIHLPHFSWLPEKVRLCILPAFVLLWILPSSFPFIALKQYMPIRTLHIAGYGPWLLMAPGLVFVLSSTLFFLSESLRNRVVLSVFIFIISAAGIQHVLYAKNAYREGNAYWEALSGNISYHAFPEGSEIVITNASTGTHQTYHQTSGYLSRLLGNRTDITGLVGDEFFYYDSFAQASLPIRSMTGLTKMDNLHLFRWVPAKNSTNSRPRGVLQPYQYFLRVITDESIKSENEKTGDWYLYSLNSNKESSIIYSGHGIEEYLQLIDGLKSKNITPQQICWGNPEDEFGCNSPERAK